MRLAWKLFAAAISILAVACGGSTGDTGGSGGGAGGATGSGGRDATSSSRASTGSSNGGGGSGSGGAPMTCKSQSIAAGDHDDSISFGGQERTYHVHAPPSYDPHTASGLVLVLHGWSMAADAMEADVHMDAKADTHGFVVVYPQGLGNSWNAGACCGQSSTDGTDDVGFIKAMIDKLEKDYCIDPKKVFSSGFSNGGMLSHRLACEASDLIAAIGAVSGTLAIDTCTPTRPVPVLHIHGMQDFVVPWGGGGLAGARAVDDTIATWVANDGCTDAMPTNVSMHGDASCDRYSHCMAGSAVELCTISDGGHQWPDANPATGVGTESMDLDASETIAQFFDAHPMP